MQVGGGHLANSIARFDGSNWSPCGAGIGSGELFDYQYVFSLAPTEDGFVAGGNFELAGGAQIPFLAQWNGSSWASLGTGVNGDVHALTRFENTLVAGGEFGTAGGASAAKLARWDGAEWHPFGSGMDDEVRALLAMDDDLFAGGYFTIAGANPSWSVAKWNQASSTVDDPMAVSSLRLRVPNPYRAGQAIRFDEPSTEPAILTIFDPAGREVRTLRGRTLAWDGRSDWGQMFDAGVYYLQARRGSERAEGRLVLVR